MATRKEVNLDLNVYDAALERIRAHWDEFDTHAVAFSGGKDSTVVLELFLKVAEEKNDLPLYVIHFDEEAIPYDTEEYVRRRYDDPRIEMAWVCAPVRHLNACARSQPFWGCWRPSEEHLWVRPMPPEATTWEMLHKDGYPDPAVTPDEELPEAPDMSKYLFPPDKWGQVMLGLGIRTGESFSRYRMMRQCSEVYLARGSITPNVAQIYPIYDWTTGDVWTGISKYDWDYNTAYDTMEMAGVSPHDQRCAPPFGAEPIGSLWRFKQCWPDIWEKIVYRVDGADAAARYAQTALYGVQRVQKPDSLSWEDYLKHYLNTWGEPMKSLMAKRISMEMKRHYKRTPEPILDSAAHPDSGISWNFLVMLASRGDYMNRKVAMLPTDGNDHHKMRLGYDEEHARLTRQGKLVPTQRYGAFPKALVDDNEKVPS